ncbi:peptidase M56 [Haloferula helveola]|uniref:Peptidase M56 n=1 Tax=Haloferula helveola TaxID=490095 RepID=A0ABM7R716_9BACT|nr:peptidase M56 [Haloferula helveola]
MTSTPIAAILFSLVAATAVLALGRRDGENSSRISGLALLLLLAFPLLSLLPKIPILPAAENIASQSYSVSVVVLVLPFGSLVLLARLAIAGWTLQRWRKGSNLLEQRTTRHGRAVEVRSLPELASPCAAGVFRPVIFVPASWTEWNLSTREMVLAHELAHHARHDPLWRWLGSLACALHWFNPLVWWLARRHALQSEFACDAAVVASGVDASAYSHTLCDLAAARTPSLALAMSGPALGERIKRLRDRPRRASRTMAGLALALLIGSALTTAICRRAAPPEQPAPDRGEVILRLTADPFPANP